MFSGIEPNRALYGHGNKTYSLSENQLSPPNLVNLPTFLSLDDIQTSVLLAHELVKKCVTKAKICQVTDDAGGCCRSACYGEL